MLSLQVLAYAFGVAAVVRSGCVCNTANTPINSPWAIASSVVCFLQLLVGFSNDVSRLRARYISTRPRGGVSHSVLITDIPCVDGLGAKEPAKKITGATQPHGYPEGRLVSGLLLFQHACLTGLFVVVLLLSWLYGLYAVDRTQMGSGHLALHNG